MQKRLKTLLTVFLIILFISLFSSCAEKFELSVSSSDGGSITMEPAGGLYKVGDTVTLTASPSSGYSFTGWGDISGYSADYSSDRTIEIIMPAKNLDVSAVFSVPNNGWTFMVYMAGDNNLSPYVSTDINEIEKGLYEAVNNGNSLIDGVVRVLVLADRLTSNDTKLYLIEPDNTTAIASLELSAEFNPGGELNMADPATLKNFINYSRANFPSVYNALVLWNHGGGVRSLEQPTEQVRKAICEDDSDIMYMNEVQGGLESALGSSKLDIIGIDACIMGEVETAYELREQADYFVASMAEEWGRGWGYEYIFDKFTSADSPPSPADMADILVTQFYESTNGEATYFSNTMTAVKTSELGNLKAAIDDLASAVYSFGAGSTAQDAFEAARDETVFYYEPARSNDTVVDDDIFEYSMLAYPYYDIYDLCMEIKNSTTFESTAVSVQADNVLTALDAAIVAAYGNSSAWDATPYLYTEDQLGLNYYETDDSTAVRGLSIFIPHGELIWDGYTHYAYDWWYSTDVFSSTTVLSNYGAPQGGLDFCTFDSDGTVETWRELFEAWYDPLEQYTDGTY